MANAELRKKDQVPEPMIPDLKDGFLMYGRQLTKAINVRIVYCTTTVDYYGGVIAELEANRDTLKARNYLADMKTKKAVFEQLSNYYVKLRDRLYEQADLVNENKSEDYRKMFKLIYLDGLSKDAVREEMGGIDQKTFDSLFHALQMDVFDNEEDEYGYDALNMPLWAYIDKLKEKENAINVPNRGRGKGKDEAKGNRDRRTCESVHSEGADPERELD